MNQKVLRTLEYNKIVERLAEYAFGADTKERCLSLLPSTSLSEIINAQQQTKDAMNRSLKKGRLDCSGIKPLSSAIRRVEIGGTMNIEELLGLCKLLETARRVKAYGRKEREDIPSDSLSELFDGLEPLSPLCDEIRRCIISVDEISDDASSNLKSIRRSIRSTGDRIHAQLNQMLNNQNVRNCLQDFVITMRNGRYCLPVKAEAKSQITGMVHDQSSSGSTLFIEPMAVVNLNNELKELSIKEQDEIAVILATLSAKAGEYIPAIETDYQILTELDFIFAKAAYALEYNGITPHFNTERKIRILKGRHPLLDAKKVVPIDISLGSDFDQLVITGPNGGGKSTLAKVLMGIEKASAGQIILDGEDISNYDINHRADAGIGYAFQQPPRFKGMTVMKLLSLSAGKELKREECCKLLSTVGLCANEYIEREVDGTLSGGEMKRLEIATVLAKSHKLCIFDEPEAGIDLWSFSMLIEQFEKIHKEKKESLVLISHQERIIQMADRIMVIEDGKIASIGATDEILPQLLGKTADSYSCLTCR